MQLSALDKLAMIMKMAVLKNEVTPKWYQKYKKVLIIGGTVVIIATAAVITYVVLRKKSALTEKRWVQW